MKKRPGMARFYKGRQRTYEKGNVRETNFVQKSQEKTEKVLLEGEWR